MKVRTVLFRLKIAFMIVFAGTMMAMDYEMFDIQILVANALSAVMLAILLSRQIYIDRKDWMVSFNKLPWLSGFVCASASGFLIMSISPTRHTEFMDYTITITVVPIALLLIGITGWSRLDYVERKQKAERDREAKQQKTKVGETTTVLGQG